MKSDKDGLFLLKLVGAQCLWRIVGINSALWNIHLLWRYEVVLPEMLLGHC